MERLRREAETKRSPSKDDWPPQLVEHAALAMGAMHGPHPTEEQMHESLRITMEETGIGAHLPPELLANVWMAGREKLLNDEALQTRAKQLNRDAQKRHAASIARQT